MASFALCVAALAASVLPVHGAAPYCLPGDACFPSEKDLAKLNETVGGNLIKTTPYGAECYGSTYNADACAALAKSKRDPEYRINLPGKQPQFATTSDEADTREISWHNVHQR
jgi:hypothetical protein